MTPFLWEGERHVFVLWEGQFQRGAPICVLVLGRGKGLCQWMRTSTLWEAGGTKDGPGCLTAQPVSVLTALYSESLTEPM
jgi:hypothetical protein